MTEKKQDPTAEETPEEPLDWPTEPERIDEAAIDPKEFEVKKKDITAED